MTAYCLPIDIPPPPSAGPSATPRAAAAAGVGTAVVVTNWTPEPLRALNLTLQFECAFTHASLARLLTKDKRPDAAAAAQAKCEECLKVEEAERAEFEQLKGDGKAEPEAGLEAATEPAAEPAAEATEEPVPNAAEE